MKTEISKHEKIRLAKIIMSIYQESIFQLEQLLNSAIDLDEKNELENEISNYQWGIVRLLQWGLG